MDQIIDVEQCEAREWLNVHSDWEFVGEVNKISHNNVIELVNNLYQAGSVKVFISEYEWEIEPVYEGDEFVPDMLIVNLPKNISQREVIFEIVNKSLPELKQYTYKDTGKKSLWYFFELNPHSITVGKKKITWYS